jgi:predicted nucleic acid-binding protein
MPVADLTNSICYLDTTIFVYLFDTVDQLKYRRARSLVDYYLTSGKGRISVQVLAEWRNVMVKKYSAVVDASFRQHFIAAMKAWNPVSVTMEMVVGADKLTERYNLSPYDSLHIQAALDAGCNYFLSEDMQSGLVIDKRLTIIDPFMLKDFLS